MRILPEDTILFPKASLLKHLLRILIPLANLVNTHGYLLHTEQGTCYQDWCVCVVSTEQSGVDYGEEGGQLKGICLNRAHLWASLDILCLMTISWGPAGKDTLWEVDLSVLQKQLSDQFFFFFFFLTSFEMTRKHVLPSDQLLPSQCLFHISKVFWLGFPWKSTFLVSSPCPSMFKLRWCSFLFP